MSGGGLGVVEPSEESDPGLGVVSGFVDVVVGVVFFVDVLVVDVLVVDVFVGVVFVGVVAVVAGVVELLGDVVVLAGAEPPRLLGPVSGTGRTSR